MALSAHPTSTVAQGKLAAALAGIQTFANNTATKLQADAGTVQAVISADLTALAVANPVNANLQAAVGKMGGDLANLLTSAGSHLPVIEADLQQVLTDFGAGA
jgi:ABC-type Fe3+ transport system substrate-binding protein